MIRLQWLRKSGLRTHIDHILYGVSTGVTISFEQLYAVIFCNGRNESFDLQLLEFLHLPTTAR